MEYGEMPPSKNYAGYYHLGDTTDFSGNGRTFTTISGTVNFGAGSKFSTGMTTSSSGYVLYPRDCGVDGSNECTLSIWVKYVGQSGTWNYMCDALDGTTKTQYFIQYNSSTTTLYFLRDRIGVGAAGPSKVYTLPTTSYTHLAMAYDKTSVYGYLNGAAVGPGVAASGNGGTSYASHISIGGYIGLDAPNRNFLYGTYDEYIVERRCWSAAEMRRYYALCTGQFGPKVSML